MLCGRWKQNLNKKIIIIIIIRSKHGCYQIKKTCKSDAFMHRIEWIHFFPFFLIKVHQRSFLMTSNQAFVFFSSFSLFFLSQWTQCMWFACGMTIFFSYEFMFKFELHAGRSLQCTKCTCNSTISMAERANNFFSSSPFSLSLVNESDFDVYGSCSCSIIIKASEYRQWL